jgi:transcriptional regulator with XRE-family HTH domain
MKETQFVRYEGAFDFEAGLEAAKKHPAYWQEDLLLTVANRLSSEMAAQGITQAELARRLDVSPAYVSRLLRGHENLTLQTLARIAFELGRRWECLVVSLNECMILYAAFAAGQEKVIRRVENTLVENLSPERASLDESAYQQEEPDVVRLSA